MSEPLKVKLSDPKQREIAMELIAAAADAFRAEIKVKTLEAQLAVYSLQPGEFRYFTVEPLKFSIENCMEETAEVVVKR